LAKEGYVEPGDFVCPCRSEGKALEFDASKVRDYNDFPARRYVTYSFRIRYAKAGKSHLQGPQALIADLNPLFERLPDDYSRPFKLKPNKDLLVLNSINHNRRGQNVLFCDGSVKFVKVRHIGAAADDIFTLQNTDVYEGVELPSCEADAFLAP
jgi:prepilin-type processing-associated H-X9-DG protein